MDTHSTMLVTGDSWTSGWPLEEELGHRLNSWPSLVATNLGYNLIDKSRARSSNYRIYRKAFDGLLSEKVDFVIVFLTKWYRMETGSTYGEKPGRIYQHIPRSTDPESEYVFKNFFNGYKNYSDMLRMVISLQSIAQEVSVPCYFLDTFEDNLLFDITEDDFKKILRYNIGVFDNMSDDRISDKFNKIQMLTSKIDKNLFISLQSYQSLIDGCLLEKGHPVQDGHIKISQTVLKFLKENNHGN